MMSWMKTVIVAGLLLVAGPLFAANLSDIQVSNGGNQATVTLSFLASRFMPIFPYIIPTVLFWISVKVA